MAKNKKTVYDLAILGFLASAGIVFLYSGINKFIEASGYDYKTCFIIGCVLIGGGYILKRWL